MPLMVRLHAQGRAAFPVEVPAEPLAKISVSFAAARSRHRKKLQPIKFMMMKLIIFGAIAGAFFVCTIARGAEIKIGVAAALTGNASQYGVPIRKGFELAVGEINGSGGVNGNRLELVIEDEQGKKEEAINVFRKLIFQDKV